LKATYSYVYEPFTMTFGDLQGHSPITSLSNEILCSCVAVGLERRAVPLRQLNFF